MVALCGSTGDAHCLADLRPRFALRFQFLNLLPFLRIPRWFRREQLFRPSR